MSIVQKNAAAVGRRAATTASSTPVDATIGLVAGRGVAGYLGDGGPATLAQLNGPTGVAVDAAGGILVVDASNRVRRVAYGTITTIAGSGVAGHVSEGLPLPEDGGPAIDAQMNNPIGVALDRDGNILIADALYHRIRRVTPDGTITTIAGNGIPSFLGDGGPATAANLQYPTGVALDHDGNVFIADAGNHRIRRIDPDGTITTVAGSGVAGFAGDGGPATEARLHKPTGVAVSRKGRPHRRRVQPPHPSRGHPRADQHRRRRHRDSPHVRRMGAWQLQRRRRAGHRGLPELSHRGPARRRAEPPDRRQLERPRAQRGPRRHHHDDRGRGSEPTADGLPATSVSLAGGPTGMAFDGAGGLLVCEEHGHRVWRLTR